LPRHPKLRRLTENFGAAGAELSTDELTAIEDPASKIEVKGGHYSPLRRVRAVRRMEFETYA